MKLKQIRDDTRGSALIEFTVTIPFFLVLTFGLVQAGLLLYTQNGLQHGVEVAARCASVNYSTYRLSQITGLSLSSCFGRLASAVTATDIQQMAVQKSWGIVPDPTIVPHPWTVDCPNSVTAGCNTSNYKCGTNPGYRVSVTYQYNLISYIFKPLPLTAESCFPINVS